jgi:hypothetical protein
MCSTYCLAATSKAPLALDSAAAARACRFFSCGSRFWVTSARFWMWIARASSIVVSG